MTRVVVTEDIRPIHRDAGRLIRAGETGEELRRERPEYGYAAIGSRSIVRFDKDPEDTHNVPSRMLRAAIEGVSRDPASEYGRLLAERDRLVDAGVDPADLDMPERPEGVSRDH